MAYEVELKFQVRDPKAMEEAAKTLGVVFGDAIEETDLYFQHPCRNFVETDEAFRLRNQGGELRITYKGARVDATTKTRKEIEIPLFPDVKNEWIEILESLGFKIGGKVFKLRRSAEISFRERSFNIVLDELPVLAPHSHYIEIETLADEADLEAAKTDLRALAETLSLDPAETIRTSYLALTRKAGGLKI